MHLRVLQVMAGDDAGQDAQALDALTLLGTGEFSHFAQGSPLSVETGLSSDDRLGTVGYAWKSENGVPVWVTVTIPYL